MPRPTIEEITTARANGLRLLAGEPVDKPSDVLKTLLAATEPRTACPNPDCENGLVYEGECSKCHNSIPHDCPECSPVKP
jgi:cytochrome c5